MNKELKKLFRELENQGWRIKRRTNGVMAFPPDKTQSPVMIHLTTSDHRAWANMLTELRRRGYKG